MAAAIIPIATTVIPLILPWVVKLMDKIFGSKTGAVKLATGTAVAQQIMTALQTILAGQGISLPTSVSEIQTLLQGVVTDLNGKGELLGTATVIDGTPLAILPPGKMSNNALASLLVEAASGLLKAGS